MDARLQTEDICIKLVAHNEGLNYGRRATALERLFGILPEISNSSSKNIHVAGLTAGSSALLSGQIQIGDCLLYVNNSLIYWDNVDNILANILPGQEVSIKISRNCAPDNTLLRLHSANCSNHSSFQGSSRYKFDIESLIRYIQSCGLHINAASLSQNPVISSAVTSVKALPINGCFVIFCQLGLDSEKMITGKEDILYTYPLEGGASSSLQAVRGVFLTLSQVLQDMSKQSFAKGCTFKSASCVWNSRFIRSNDVLVAVCFSEQVTCSITLDTYAEALQQLLRFFFSDFSAACIRPEVKKFFDCLFTVSFAEFLNDEYEVRMSGTLPAMAPLPPKIQAEIDDGLSSLESSDILEIDDEKLVCSMHRKFFVVGSCVMFRQSVICSHMPSQTLQQTYNYLRMTGLLTLANQSVALVEGELLSWKEVFLDSSNDGCMSKSLSGVRNMLLCMRSGAFILCCLFETRGFSSKVASNLHEVDWFYVKELRSAIRKWVALKTLQAVDMSWPITSGVAHCAMAQQDNYRSSNGHAGGHVGEHVARDWHGSATRDDAAVHDRKLRQRSGKSSGFFAFRRRSRSANTFKDSAAPPAPKPALQLAFAANSIKASRSMHDDQLSTQLASNEDRFSRNPKDFQHRLLSAQELYDRNLSWMADYFGSWRPFVSLFTSPKTTLYCLVDQQLGQAKCLLLHNASENLAEAVDAEGLSRLQQLLVQLVPKYRKLLLRRASSSRQAFVEIGCKIVIKEHTFWLTVRYCVPEARMVVLCYRGALLDNVAEIIYRLQSDAISL